MVCWDLYRVWGLCRSQFTPRFKYTTVTIDLLQYSAYNWNTMSKFIQEPGSIVRKVQEGGTANNTIVPPIANLSSENTANGLHCFGAAITETQRRSMPCNIHNSRRSHMRNDKCNAMALVHESLLTPTSNTSDIPCVSVDSLVHEYSVSVPAHSTWRCMSTAINTIDITAKPLTLSEMNPIYHPIVQQLLKWCDNENCNIWSIPETTVSPPCSPATWSSTTSRASNDSSNEWPIVESIDSSFAKCAYQSNSNSQMAADMLVPNTTTKLCANEPTAVSQSAPLEIYQKTGVESYNLASAQCTRFASADTNVSVYSENTEMSDSRADLHTHDTYAMAVRTNTAWHAQNWEVSHAMFAFDEQLDTTVNMPKTTGASDCNSSTCLANPFWRASSLKDHAFGFHCPSINRSHILIEGEDVIDVADSANSISDAHLYTATRICSKTASCGQLKPSKVNAARTSINSDHSAHSIYKPLLSPRYSQVDTRRVEAIEAVPLHFVTLAFAHTREPFLKVHLSVYTLGWSRVPQYHCIVEHVHKQFQLCQIYDSWSLNCPTATQVYIRGIFEVEDTVSARISDGEVTIDELQWCSFELHFKTKQRACDMRATWPDTKSKELHSATVSAFESTITHTASQLQVEMDTIVLKTKREILQKHAQHSRAETMSAPFNDTGAADDTLRVPIAPKFDAQHSIVPHYTRALQDTPHIDSNYVHIPLVVLV